MRVLTTYERHTGRLAKPLEVAVVSDLHNEAFEDVFPLIEGADALLVPGDISDRYRQKYETGVRFLKEAAKRIPTFFSVGNHETRQTEYRTLMNELEHTGAQILLNRFVQFEGIWIGGWYDPEIIGVPDMLDAFEKLDGVKVLMCHKPEEYLRCIQGRKIDLTVAGHAHGGQLRIGPVGILSPGQGFFPRYAKGVKDDGRLIVTTGAGNPCRMPRWGNPCEVVRIQLD